MKRLLFVFLFFQLSREASAQLLTANPSFPLDTSTVTIVADCSKGNQGLYNYATTGDVYVHTGVITNLSTTQSDWRYVKFNQNFNQPNAALQATYLGNNEYSFTISNIRNYFGVPAGETILKVAILFRNGNGTSVERNRDGSDMYVAVYGSALAAQFLQPPFQPLYTPAPEPINKNVGDTLPLNYISNKPATLTLHLNGALLDSVSGAQSVQYKAIIAPAGNQQVIAMANDGTNNRSDTINFYVAPSTTIAALPAGAVDGINYLPGDTSALLVLFAPHKKRIMVVGDFNNWVQQPAYQMNETPDSNYFWLQLNGLTPGTEYAYQYIIDDSIVVADYNTEKVLDKNVDPYISPSTYPNLKSFPSQAQGSLAGIIQTAKPAYPWQANNFQRPDRNGLVIYELCVRDFLNAGNWQTLTDTLDYLQALGINAIEVMPFTNFEGASSWGYNPNFYFAPDKVYGTETNLKKFIDACHLRGIAVIMDMVLNHSFGSSPMVQMYWDSRNNIPAANNPWFNQYPTHAYNVGYQFNHESPATKLFTQRVIAYWLNNYHIDGYRFDLAKGFTQKNTCDAMGNNCNVDAWGAYDSSRVAIWDTIYQQQQAISPGSYCILEMFADNSEEKVEAGDGMMLWGNMNDNFNQATMGYSSPSPSGGTWDFSGGIYKERGWSAPNLVAYQESHDEERLMYKNEQYGNSSGSYNIKDVSTGLKRNEMAAAFWAIIPGPKMLWEFGELGYDYSINTCTNGAVDGSGSCRTDPKPIHWDYLQNTGRKHLHDVYAALLKLHEAHPGLNTSGNIVYSLSGAFKTLQVADSGISITVIGNFDVISTPGSVAFQHTGTWYNYLTGDSLQVNNVSQSFNLSAGEYRVYTDKNIHDSTLQVPDTVTHTTGLSVTVYPNPVLSGTGYIKYQLAESGNTDISIISMNGRRVSGFNAGMQDKGVYILPLNQLLAGAPQLSKGVYIVYIRSNGKKAHASFLMQR